MISIQNFKHTTQHRLVFLAFLFILGLYPLASQATLLGQDITITFSEVGFEDLVDTVTVTENKEILPFDGSNIGDDILLDFESIDIGSESIVLELQGGGGNHSIDGYSILGFDTNTFYLFEGLNWGGIPGKITGVTIDLVDIIGVDENTDPIVEFTNESVKLFIGTLGIKETAGVDVGTITLDLTVEHSPVPLPASLPLFLSALIFVSRRFRLK